jgi:hypothetical protein
MVSTTGNASGLRRGTYLQVARRDKVLGTIGREHHRRMRFVLPILGVVLVLVGAVWTLQGANLLGGSFMSGSRLWLLIGLVALAAGIWLVVRAVRARRA